MPEVSMLGKFKHQPKRKGCEGGQWKELEKQQFTLQTKVLHQLSRTLGFLNTTAWQSPFSILVSPKK